MRQVITIGPDGGLSGLQVKPGKGLDLRQFGKASIERASEIEWNAADQAWEIKILKGKHAGRKLTALDFMRADLHARGGAYEGSSDAVEILSKQVLQYANYDDAVKDEILILDHIRITEGPDAL